MAKQKLTVAFVAEIGDKIKVEKRTDFWDTVQPCFMLRVTPTGAKSYAVLYNYHGQPKRLTLGDTSKLTLGKARRQARKVLGEVAEGKDPQGAKVAARVKAKRDAIVGTTFSDLAARYLAHKEKGGKRSVKIDARMIRVDLKEWADRPLEGPNKVGRKDVDAVMAAIAKRGVGVYANRVLALINGIFNLGIGWGVVDYNPAHLFPKPATEVVGERWLTDEEIKGLWKALDAKPAKVAAFFKLCLITGCRPREVIDAVVGEFDFDAALWTIPAARIKTGRKSGDHVLPLTAPMLDLIEGIKNGTPRLFPFGSGDRAAYWKWLDDLRDELKFEPHWDARTLRRTVATGMARIGIPDHITERVFNHMIPGMGAKHYIKHAYLDEKREALIKWGAEVARIVA